MICRAFILVLSICRWWGDLEDEERKAAEVLGYNKKTWDKA